MVPPYSSYYEIKGLSKGELLVLNLFRPGKIGNLQIKNRIVMGPMGITGLLEPDGRYSQRGIDFYVRRAAGGAGI